MSLEISFKRFWVAPGYSQIPGKSLDERLEDLDFALRQQNAALWQDHRDGMRFRRRRIAGTDEKMFLVVCREKVFNESILNTVKNLGFGIVP